MKSSPELTPPRLASPRPPAGALLFLGDYYGTLAAARCLGRRGIDVALADNRRLSRTSASRFVRHVFVAPDMADGPALVRWLMESSHPLDGRVLYPASDDLVYLFAEHQHTLKRRYRLLLPGFDRVWVALNKRRLYEEGSAVGLKGPKTWFPADPGMARSLAADADGDVVIKPKTQVQSLCGIKGLRVSRGDDLEAAMRRVLATNRYAAGLRDRDPDACVPMIQAYHAEAAGATYSVAGFSTGTDQAMPLRAARKLLQRPRGFGVGVCFEGVAIRPDLRERIAALCARLDYVGIFEAEFIERDDQLLLIDFNPRAYGQMAFEDARGLPLAYLHYLAATGDDDRLAVECARARQAPEGSKAFCQGSLLGLIRSGQAAARVFGRAAEPWGAWIAHHGDELADAVRSSDDPRPQVADLLVHLRDFLRHPRAFVRSLQR